MQRDLAKSKVEVCAISTALYGVGSDRGMTKSGTAWPRVTPSTRESATDEREVCAPSKSPPGSSALDTVIDSVLRPTEEFRRFARDETNLTPGPADFIFTDAELNTLPVPEEIFAHLRWGGRFVYASRDRRGVEAMAPAFAERGFHLGEGPGCVRTRTLLGLPIPFLSKSVHYLLARKVLLVPPRQFSDRFTYNVQLVEGPGKHMIVRKEVPTLERVKARLQHKFPEVAEDVIEARARKFSDKIFPLFLTREAAVLKILQRDLPPEYARRVPSVIDIKQDERGYVTRLWMNWLRNGGENTPLHQLDFAEQCADLLRALHDRAGVIHLDLRQDNLVVTRDGVGFVDFGSAVRVGEDISGNPLLATLFDELMRTSQIQRMMEKMEAGGTLTSPAITKGLHRVDKAVDLFYLAVLMSNPRGNPDVENLIRFDPGSQEAKALSMLTRQVLRPDDPNNPPFKTAADLLEGIRRVRDELGQRAQK